MATLANQSIVRTGIGPAYAAASAGGDKFTPDDKTFLHVKNASAGALTVTIATPGTVIGQNIDDLAVSVPAAGERIIGPFPAQHFANAADAGLAAITYSGVGSLTIGAFRVVQP